MNKIEKYTDLTKDARYYFSSILQGTTKFSDLELLVENKTETMVKLVSSDDYGYTFWRKKEDNITTRDGGFAEKLKY